jgi:rhodanese-related sulfurtransferase
MCGKNLSDEAVSTIGEQRRYNYALQPMSREEFKQIVTAEQPEAPDYFVHDAVLNRQDRPSLQESMKDSLTPLELDDVIDLQKRGAQVVDVRDAADFAGAHLVGSINIGIDGKYATWCGTVLDKDRPIVVVADSGREEEAIMRLGRIGFDQVAGYLQNGPKALDKRPDLVGVTHRVTAKALAEQLAESNSPLVVDVRAEKEWQSGHIESAVNAPLNRLREWANDVPQDTKMVIHCQGGYRSSIAASILEQEGFGNVADLVGGFQAWSKSGLPIVEPSTSTAQP